MPIWDEETTPAVSQSETITRSVQAGDALPILSHSALFDLALFSHQAFKRFYAEKIRFPYPNLPDISQLANYDRYANRSSDIECKNFYLDCLKNHIYREAKAHGAPSDTLIEAAAQADRVGVTRFAEFLGYPNFDLPHTQPLRVLANLPFSIYLTISANTFLEKALRKSGKQPLSKMCRWSGSTDGPDKDLWQITDDYRPSEEQPLVYHLCGLDAHPQTGAPLPAYLALSEDDHLEMLVNLAECRGNDRTDRLPALVRGAFGQTVVLLGFRLDSWAFRGLYYGLIRQTGQELDRRGVCVVQLSSEERATQEKYVQRYLNDEARFDIFWGDLHEYTSKLQG